MPILTDEEADALDKLLTKTIPATNPNIQGPFIKNCNKIIILDRFSAEYLRAKMLATKQTPAEQIHSMICREMEHVKTSI